MNRYSKLIALALVCLCMTSCGVLDYPDYWETDDNFFVNIITFPFEVIFTPIIFVVKLLPVL